MMFYAAFKSISGISHYSCLSWVSPGWGSELSYPRTLPRKTQRIQCSLNPGPLDYELNTPPLSHAGPPLGTSQPIPYLLLTSSIYSKLLKCQSHDLQHGSTHVSRSKRIYIPKGFDRKL